MLIGFFSPLLYYFIFPMCVVVVVGFHLWERKLSLVLVHLP